MTKSGLHARDPHPCPLRWPHILRLATSRSFCIVNRRYRLHPCFQFPVVTPWKERGARKTCRDLDHKGLVCSRSLGDWRHCAAECPRRGRSSSTETGPPIGGVFLCLRQGGRQIYPLWFHKKETLWTGPQVTSRSRASTSVCRSKSVRSSPRPHRDRASVEGTLGKGLFFPS